MKRIALFAFAALVMVSLYACHREEPFVPDDGTYTYSLSVWNSDYIQDVILEEMGQVKLSSVEGLPAWVSGVTLSEELLKGNSVAQISVNRNPGLEEKLTADITLKMTNGATAKLNLVQWPSRPVENAPVQSVNTAFQKDWAGTEMITIVTGNRYVNGIPELVTETVRLPWAQNSNHHLPKGEVTKMLDHKGDWRMVFNFTGVQSLPGCHYFGLYNRYSGILRVFYYLHKNDVPTNGNDHLWSFELDESLAQHVAAQFALPYNEKATYDFKKYAAQPFLVTPYANRADGLSNGKYLPTQDWWAFDVDMSAARNHDFFSEKPGEYASRIGMKLYKEDNVMLNSVLKGCLDGALKGKINLDQLAPNGTSVGGSVCGGLLGGVGDVFTNKFILEQLGNNHTKLGIGMVIFGCALSAAGKILESEWKDDDDPSSKLGSINADINLDLNATMTTEGIVGGDATNTIPPATLMMQDFWSQTASKEPTGFGKGVWNLKNHPVIYVVKDAFWHEFNFTVSESKLAYKKDGQDVYYYQLATDPDRPGLRIISFFDPTSVGGIYLNNDVYDLDVESCDVQLTYGVFPSSVDGYTAQFKKAAGIQTPTSWRMTSMSKFNVKKEKDKLDFKLYNYKKDDAIFKTTGAIDPEYAEYVAYRRSEQGVTEKSVRRYYGPSVFYSKETATPYDVDQVHFVADPQIDIPLSIVKDEGDNWKEAYRFYDPQLPDFVVTGILTVRGRDKTDNENQVMVHTLRFVPKIEYISVKDMQRVYDSMLSRKDALKNVSGRNVTVEWPFMDEQISKVKGFIDAIAKVDADSGK